MVQLPSPIHGAGGGGSRSNWANDNSTFSVSRPMEIVDRIFDPLFTTKPNGMGTRTRVFDRNQHASRRVGR
jgi:hypothetical protein